jgi:acyl-CoA reductase-like NAD-dependent aldehyde dehydrogenase
MVISSVIKSKSLHVGVTSYEGAPNFSHYSPVTGELLSVFPMAREFEVDNAIKNARHQMTIWGNKTMDERGLMIRRACQLLEKNADLLIDQVRAETGKSENLARGELQAAIEFGYLVSSFGKLPLGGILPSSVQGKSVAVTRVPRGVCALIVSFNTPMPNYAWKVFPALISGNVAILKPSPYTAMSAKMFADIMLEAGIPEHVLQVVQGDELTGSLIVKGDVELISFTGSSSTGAGLVQSATNKFAKLILELGGANPFIVFKDAMIDRAVEFAIQSCFSNSGQRCSSASRLILHESIEEEFLEKLVNAMTKMTYGTEDECFLGPVISKEAANRLKNYLADCVEVGARITPLAKKLGDSISLVQPSLVFGLDPNHRLSVQEIFGPIARVYSFQTEEEALQLANCTDYGLTAAIWTQDFDLSARLSHKIIAGLVNINGPTHGAEPNMPFGGFGASGNGTKEAGIESINSYSDLKVITNFRHLD